MAIFRATNYSTLFAAKEALINFGSVKEVK